MSTNRALLALLLTAAAFWSWLAFGVHTVEIVGGELDQYVWRAQAMLAGTDNQDAYHPAGLPVWIATLGWLGVDPFTGGRLLGVLFGLVLLWASHGLARLWLSRRQALLVAAIVGLNPCILVTTVQACSDVPAAALTTLALWQWCRAARDGATTKRLVVGGLAFGIAASFRSPVIWLVLGWLPLLRDGGGRERLRRCGWTAGAILVGMLPHFVWYQHAFGSPLHNRSWANLLLKFHFHYDVPAWVAATPQYEALFRAHWTSWLVPGLQDAAGFVTTRLAMALALEGPGLAPTLLSLGVFATLLHALVAERARGMLAIATLGYAALLAATFRPFDRLAIPLVPIVTLLLAIPFTRVAAARGADVVLALLLVTVAWRAPAALHHFERSHPHAELAAVAELRDRLGEPMRVVVRPFFHFETDDPWRELRRELHAHDQEFAVLSRATSAPAIDALLALPTPPDFRILRRDDVLVLDASATPAPWLTAASVEPRDGTLHLALQLAGPPADDPIVMAGFLLGVERAGEREWQQVPLPSAGPNTYALTWTRPELRSLPCRFVPAAIHASGMIRRGEPIEVTP